jgi:serine/threonine protein phosphatase PrpC
MVELTTANAGDSRVVLGCEGKATRLTKDHRSDDPLEVTRIEQAGGFLFRGRVLGVLAVTRSIGDHVLKKYVIAHPYVRQETVDLSALTGDSPFLILACDGFFDVIDDQYAVDLVVRFQGDRADVAGHLVEEALRRGTTDNVSVIVAWL